MPGRQDTGYKLLFSHAEMVRDLLTGFVPGGWITEADFSTLERHSASFVSDSEKQRHDGMIWRVRVKEAEHMLATRAEGWFKEAERKGKAEGKVEGKLEGKAEGLAEGRQQLTATVQRQLTRRFGEFPPSRQWCWTSWGTSTLSNWRS